MRWSAVCASAALLVAACGDDDDDSSDTTSPAAETTVATSDGAGTSSTPASPGSEPASTDGGGADPTGEPIKLMVVYDAEPAGTNVTDSVDGAKAAAEAVNRAGGVAGRPVEIIPCDDKNDPNASRECAQQAVSEGVAAVVGGVTFLASEILPVLEQNSIPWIGAVPIGNAELTSPMSFPLTGAILEFAGAGAALVDAGTTNLSLARIDVAEGAAFANFVTLGTQRSGVEVVNDVAIPPGAPDMSSYAAAALENNADGVLIGVVVQDAINMTVALEQSNPDVHIAVSTSDPQAYVGAVTDALGADADGIMLMSQTTEFAPNEAWATFESDMEAAGFDPPQGIHPANTYASVKVFADIAMDLPDITAATVLAALPTASGIRTGIVPVLDFTTGGGVGGLPRIFNACMMTTVIRGGERVAQGGFFDATTGEPCPEP